LIPADVRLYTWLDAEDVLSQAATDGKLPHWFVRSQAYWDSLTLEIRPGFLEDARAWIVQLLEPRIIQDETGISLVLEGLPSLRRILQVQIEEVNGDPPLAPLVPRFKRPTFVTQNVGIKAMSQHETSAPVLAFHSFKGGVGRTTQAVAMTLAIAESRRVMLIDADFEAPGITWLLKTRLPDPPISFADVLAIAHGDTSANCKDTLELVSDRLQGSSFDNCVFLPAFRSTGSLQTLDIRPEHVCIGKQDPFFLTTFIGNLAKRLAVDLVVVDLRAGFSELAAGLLLDPRVYRVFVTTLAGQSLEGTQLLMEYLGTRAASTSDSDPYPAIVLTQVPETLEGNTIASRLEPLFEAWQKFLPSDQLAEAEPVVIRLGFDKALQALPADWTLLTEAIKKSEAYGQANVLKEWLPLRDLSQLPPVSLSDVSTLRRRVAEDAGLRVFAEKGAGEDFLYTPALRALADDHLSTVPITIVVGAKGAGKTLTFRELARLGKWEQFTDKVVASKGTSEAFIVPVLLPSELDETLAHQIRKVSEKTAGALGNNEPCLQSDLRDYIRKCLTNLSDESEWRDAWLDVIAWSAGYRNGKTGIAKDFIGHIVSTGSRLIAIFDGLEDLFQTVAVDPKMQRALRALVQDVPQWLSQIPNRVVGVIVFIRRDLVESAVQQNSAQLLDRYKPYALNWNRAEALRLTYWLLSRVKAVPAPPSNFTRLTEEEIAEMLVPVWGKKLGQDNSREA
jgi:MinD-like ATPase involved in chromosome partitioning or flagellar assembly